MKKQTNKDIFNYLIEQHKKRIQEGMDKDISILYAVVRQEPYSNVRVLPVHLENYESLSDRKILLKSVVGLMKEEKVQIEMFVNISTGWSSTNKNVVPAEDPNRIETFFATALDRESNGGTLVMKVKRTDKGAEFSKFDFSPKFSALKWETIKGTKNAGLIESVRDEFVNK